nr:hypothetical protein BaRGS_026970 [Batillaria attramentaria]
MWGLSLVIVDDEQPVFSPDWQFSQHISTTGGCVQGDQSDVILDIPQGALSQEQVVEIRGAVCTSLDEVHKQLSLPEDEYIVSPVVEYFAGPGFRSQKAMRVVMPHFLHPAFSGSSVKVYHFRRDRLGSVVCEPVLRVERDDLKYHSAAASSQVYVLAENRQIHVLTNHFSGYFCTDCGQEYPPPELLLEVHAKHVEKAANKTMAAVRLDVWDSRFNIRDFREVRLAWSSS